jgi:WD40 repeat protein
VWDATTGDIVAGPFEGHSGWVRSVAFSPDGQHIVSGTDDGTILLWDATTGKMAIGPLHGHSDSVMSVAFSPDGQRIVSGSIDRTIRVWDATTGEVVSGPFTGHVDCVNSVAFSRDGQHIVSGSDDCTIRMIDLAQHIPSELTIFNSATVRDDGWLVAKGETEGEADRLLFWVPEGQHAALRRPNEAWVISKDGVLEVDYGTLIHGANWTDCFTARNST